MRCIVRSFLLIDGVLLALAIVNVIGFVLFAENRSQVGFPLDDSWIHQTYARNLAERGEWAFTPSVPSAGSTSPLYTVLLIPGHWLNLEPFVWAYFLGILALWGTGTVSVRLGQRLFPEERGVGAATGILIVMSWHLIWAAASGMETMLFIALGLWVVHLTWRETDITDIHLNRVFWRGAFLGVIGGLLYLTRPEGVGLLGLAGLFVLLSGIYPHRVYLIWAETVGLGFLVTVLPYLLLNLDITGEILPTTADAKVEDYAVLREDFILVRYWRLILPILVGAQIVWLPGVLRGIYAIGRRNQRREWLLLLPAVYAMAHLSLFAWRLPASFQHGRYVLPVLAPLLLYAAGGMWIIVQRSNKSALGRVLARSLALSALVALPCFWFLGGQAYGNDVKIINGEMVKSAKWIADNVPEDELLAVHDIGAVGYFAPRRIFDLAGLVSPEVIPIIRNKSALVAMLCERDARWLMVFPDQNPFEDKEKDPRLEEVFSTNESFTLEAGGSGNMAVFRLHFGDTCLK